MFLCHNDIWMKRTKDFDRRDKIEYSIGTLLEFLKLENFCDLNKKKYPFMSPSGSGLLTIRIRVFLLIEFFPKGLLPR